ncbi:MAG: lipopolysaccharide biosynthesis protein [Actinomycetota bacterium]
MAPNDQGGKRWDRDPAEVLDVHDAEADRGRVKARLGTGVRWTGLSQILMQVVRVGSLLVLTRLLEPREFGLVALATIVIGLFERVLGDTGTTAAVIRHRRLTQGLASSVLWWNLCVGAVTSLVFLAGGEVIAVILGDRAVTDIVRVLGLLAIINATGYVQIAYLRRSLAFGRVATAHLTNAIMTAVGTIFFALLDYREWSLVLGNLLGSATAALLVWLLSPWRPSRYFSWEEVKEIREFSIYMSAKSFFGHLSLVGDRFVVGRFIGITELGFYGLANRLIRYPIQTSAQTYREVVSPGLARLQDDHEAVLATYRRTVGGIAFLIVPLCLLIAVLADPLVPVALGGKWIDAIDLIPPVALAGAVQAIATTTGSVYVSQGRADLLFRWSVASSLIMLAFYAVGAIWGAEGVAWGFFAGSAALTYPAFYIPLRLLGARPGAVLGPVLPTVVAALVSAGAAAGTSTLLDGSVPELVQLAVAAIVGAAVYLLYAVVRRPVEFNDLLSIVARRSGGRGAATATSSTDRRGASGDNAPRTDNDVD